MSFIFYYDCQTEFLFVSLVSLRRKLDTGLLICTMTTEEKFRAAVNVIRNLPKQGELLLYYTIIVLDCSVMMFMMIHVSFS